MFSQANSTIFDSTDETILTYNRLYYDFKKFPSSIDGIKKVNEYVVEKFDVGAPFFQVINYEKWENVYLDLLKNVKDWCKSRLIWWGHKIPLDGVDDVLAIGIRPFY